MGVALRDQRLARLGGGHNFMAQARKDLAEVVAHVQLVIGDDDA